jgi:hypothetical protein
MATMQEIALELLGAVAEGDHTTDLVKDAVHSKNPLYLGQIGSYEVWRNRSGFAVWKGEVCQCISFGTAREAIEYARELNARDQEENRRYLALRKLPLLVKSITE